MKYLRGSYVSLQSSLAFHGHIPEAVPTVTSITTGRPERITTPLGCFVYRHLQGSRLRCLERVQVLPRQQVSIATPEQALVDLCRLVPGADEPTWLEGLRLQGLEDLDPARLEKLADDGGRPKLRPFVEDPLELEVFARDNLEQLLGGR